MEDWQKEHILTNLSSLEQNTKCTERLLTKLASFLNENDNSELGAMLTSNEEIQHTRLFYNIATTKEGMYVALTKALFETSQIHAFKIFLKGYNEQGIKIVLCLRPTFDELEMTLLENNLKSLKDTTENQQDIKHLEKELEQDGPTHNNQLDGFAKICKDLFSNSFPEMQNLMHPVHLCVAESINDSETIITEKIQLIKFLSLKNENWINERLPDGTSPLLQPNVHVKLLECLVKSGADVNVVSKNMCVLHKLIEKKISPESYHNLVFLLFAHGFNHLNMPDSQQRTPLHIAIQNIELLEETMQLFKMKGVNFNAVDVLGDSVLFYAIRAGRSINLIKMLKSAGASFSHKNLNEDNVLHMCSKYGNTELLEHFLQSPEIGPNEVNSMNKDGRTPFIQGLMHSKPLNVSLIKIMKEKGLKITKHIASDGLKALLSNKSFAQIQSNAEETLLFDCLIERGGRLAYKPLAQPEELRQLTGDFLNDCFDSHNVQISFSWWNNNKYSTRNIPSFKFIDGMATKIEGIVKKEHDTVLNHLRHHLHTDLARKWIHACVVGNQVSLLKIAIDLGIPKKLFEIELETLVVVAVKYAEIEVIDLMKGIVDEQLEKNVQDVRLELMQCATGHKYKTSILQVAALRGNYDVISHLLISYNLKPLIGKAVISDILEFCVGDTRSLHDDQIKERIRIVERLVQFQPTLIGQTDKFDDSALNIPNIHIELIKRLIDLGVNVHATDGSLQNILHLCPQYMTPLEYDKFVRFLNDQGHSKIFHSQDKDERTPLFVAVRHIELLSSTLELFSSTKVDFNAKNKLGTTPLAVAASKHGCRLLDSMVRLGADIQQRSQHDRTVLHTAAGKGNLIGVEYFLMAGCEVDARDCENKTPLHLALEIANANIHEIVQLLVQHGADVNAAYECEKTPLSLALEMNKKGEVEDQTIDFLKKSGAK